MEAMDLYELVKQDENELEIFLEDHPELLTSIDKNERSALHWTVLSGRDKLFKYLLTQLKNQGLLERFINLEDDTKATPLILSVLGGNEEIVRDLLNEGATINHQNYNGHSALQYACSKGRKEIVELLLQHKADVNIIDKRGNSCLHRLASLGRDDILKMFLDNPELRVINAQNSEGNTALHIAGEDDHVVCCNLLLDKGADHTLQNKEEHTVLDICKIPLRKRLMEKLNVSQ